MKGVKLNDDTWQDIARRIKDGEKVTDIATEYNISSKTIYNRLGASSNIDNSALEISRLKRENKALKELVGKITLDLSREKKEI